MIAELKTRPRHHDTARGHVATTRRGRATRPLSVRSTLAEAALAGLGLLTKLGATLLVVGVAFTTAARAGTVTITFEEVGANVQATISGSLALTDLAFQYEEMGDSAFVYPSDRRFYSLILESEDNVDRYEASTVSGPASFGSGGRTDATSLTGDSFSFVVNPSEEGDYANILLPIGYQANQPLSGTTTWSSTTLAGLGITPGTYTWTLGSGTDSVVIQTVPEPSTLALGAAGIASAGWLRHRRRRAAARQA